MSRVMRERMEAAWGYELAMAEHCAVVIARTQGTVHVGLVVEELVRRGVIPPVRPAKGPRNRWLGVLFSRRRDVWERTGGRAVVSNRARGSHRHSVVVWRIVEGADVGPLAAEPQRPSGWSPADQPTTPDRVEREGLAPCSGASQPLPFDAVLAANEVVLLQKKGLLRGERSSPVLEELVKWLRAT